MPCEIIFTAIMGIVFLGDPTSWRFWTGGLMVFCSIVALNRLKAYGEKELQLPKNVTPANEIRPAGV